MSFKYKQVEKEHVPLLNNFYIFNNEEEIAGLMIVSKMEKDLYFIDFRNVNFESKEFKSYLSKDLQDVTNEDASWYWTKYLLKYMDSLLEKDIEIIELNDLNDLFKYDQENKNILFKISLNDFKNVGYVNEMIQEDLLEMVSKLIHKDKEKTYLTEEVKKDFSDTQAWLLENLYDNN